MSMNVTNGVSNSEFLARLLKQLVQVHKEPFVKISVQERQNCEKYGTAKAETPIVKVEVDTNDIDSNIFHDKVKVCILCKHTIATNLFQRTFSSFLDKVLQDIFQTPPATFELMEQLPFCEQCFHCVTNLRECYLKFKNAQNEYQEMLLRVRCFRKWAQKGASCDISKLYDKRYEIDICSDHVDVDVAPPNVKTEPIESLQPRARNEQIKKKYNCVEKSIRRRGGLNEEEYKEHRRAQMAGYYLQKKQKHDRLETSQTTFAKTAIKVTIDDVKSKTSLTTENDPIPSASSLFPEDDDHFEDSLESEPFEETTDAERQTIVYAPSPLSLEQAQTTKALEVKNSRRKKKYDYKGKIIRRRGGISEEQYQAHRRAQSAQYYIEKRRKLGKLTFGPKPLNAIASAKLEKAEKICLDSNKLPSRSSCGIKIPVIPLEAEKRFSYRNVEFTKDEDGTHHCSKCGHTAKVLNVMKKHIAKMHFDKEHGFKCSHCDKTFYYKFQLKYHEAGHTEKGNGIQCEECGQSFKYSSGYYHHRRSIHQGIKPHECQLCQKQFGTKKDLRKHHESKSHLARINAVNDTSNITELSKECT